MKLRKTLIEGVRSNLPFKVAIKIVALLDNMFMVKIICYLFLLPFIIAFKIVATIIKLFFWMLLMMAM